MAYAGTPANKAEVADMNCVPPNSDSNCAPPNFGLYGIQTRILALPGVPSSIPIIGA